MSETDPAIRGPQIDHRPDPCPADQLLSYWALGGYGNVPMGHAFMRWGIGWQEWVEQQLVPDLQVGYRRVMIHLPFGRLVAEGYMSFDSYLHAKRLGLRLIWRRFAKAIGRVVEGHHTDGEPVQVICYLGSLKLDPSFTRLLDDPADHDDWIRRACRSVQPVRDAGCEIAFDTGSIFKPDDPAFAFALLIRNLGAGAWMEAPEFGYIWHPQPYDYSQQAKTFHGHMADFPVALSHQHYWNNVADVEHGGWRAVGVPHHAQLKEGQKVILMLDGHSAPRNSDGTKKPLQEIRDTFPDWAPPMAQRSVEAGFSVAVSSPLMAHHGMSRETLLGCPPRLEE